MKPSLLKGTRDFLPEQVVKRNYLFKVIKSVFENFAYVPIETPSFESLSTLTGKYGEEGDRLIFKILNNGDFLSEVDGDLLEEKNSKKILPQISKRGLRYDLTVPFARFVVMHENDINFPFKRYQIQPVWRADRPQKGRYQEFYQCDADAIGSDSLLYEAELICIYDQVFSKINIPVEILVNNRKILEEMVEVAGFSDKFTSITVIIDKLDKTGIDSVTEELKNTGLTEKAVGLIKEYLDIKTIKELKDWFTSHNTISKGIEELEEVFGYISEMKFNNTIKFEPKLARGLNYYTGCILEVKAVDANMGSLGGGGRYAELTEVFGRKGMSGVGISFGAERIYDVMEEKNLFPEKLYEPADILFITMDESSMKAGFTLASRLRNNNIRCDIYPTPTNIKKQMKYANALGVPFVAIIGPEELSKNVLILKEMETGEQEEIMLTNFVIRFTEKLIG
ncbi:MAG: histidine--tRNA ligase [Deltaproteobacteria bacterium]